MRPRSWLACFLVLFAAVLLSATSLAGHDPCSHQRTAQIPFISSAYLQHAVTLDARLTTPQEWAESTPVDLTVSRWFQGEASTTGRWWLKNDDQWLYLLVRIEWPANDTDGDDGGQIDYFWPAGSCCPWAVSRCPAFR